MFSIKSIARRFNFSLRSLLIAVGVMGALCGWLGNRIVAARRQASAVSEIHGSGGGIIYDYQKDCSNPEPEGPAPEFVRAILGDDLFQNVEAVDLREMHVTRRIAESLTKLGKFRYLRLSGSTIDDDAWEVIARLRNFHRLSVPSEALFGPRLADLEQWTQLTWLEISANAKGIPDATLERVARLPQLKELILQGKASDDGLQHLRELKLLTRLVLYEVSGCSDKGMSFLAELPLIEELTLQCPSLSDDALQYCAHMTHLRAIRLEGTQVTGKGFDHFALLPHLQRVDGHRAPLNDECLKWLAKCRSLRIFHFSGKLITAEALAEFEKENPSVSVYELN
jgi:hypothetical protein